MRIGKKLRAFFIVNLLLVLFLLITSYTVSNIITNEMYEKTYLDYSEQITRLLRNTFNGLEALVSDISNDEEIYNIIVAKDTNKNKESRIINNLKYGKALLIATTFVDSIDVVDIKRNKVYSSQGYEKNFNIKSRPWYNEAIIEDSNGQNIILTDVHRSFINNRYVLSILSFIKDDNGNRIGCVVLNAYMDQFTRYMEEIYGEDGNLQVYIKLGCGEYYSYRDGVVTLGQIKENRKNYIVNKGKILFVFDKNKALINATVKKVNNINLIIFIIFFVVTFILAFVVERTILKSLLQNISKLKNNLKALNKYSEEEVEDKNGFDQLDYIVNSFDEALNERVKEYILTDSLTGVLNRRGLEKEFNRLVKKDSKMAIIFLDLDKFKNINDVYGHTVGDEYLKEFSSILQRCLGDKGILARISGDEFIILYKKFSNNRELESYYRKNIGNVFNNTKLLDNKIIIRYSAGVSIYPKDGDNLSELIKKSDYVMYRNKKKGLSNGISFFDDNGYEEIKKEETISIELQKALKKDELFIVYQPIVNKEGKVSKAEALIRWNSHKLGFVPPDKFIKIAEENKEIIGIGYWVFKQVCRDIKKLEEHGIYNIVINVNVSAIQLLEPNFAMKVKNIISKYGLSCSNINIEITESVMIEEDEVSLNNLNKFKKFGFTLSLDDFGTGYTSFAYLKKFQGEFLKIDKTILDDADENEYRIINSIKDIGKELEFKIVIEGVEEEEQFNKLRELDCDLFQGYYFSKPMDLKEFIEYVKHTNN